MRPPTLFTDGIAQANEAATNASPASEVAARTVTLKGPERTLTVNVAPEAQPFDKIKVGDSVYLEVIQAIAAAVAKSAPAAQK